MVTYYFTQQLLPKIINGNDNKGSKSETVEAELLSFVKEYGSYLKLDTCLSYSAMLRAEKVIDLLLMLAKNDPRHKEGMKLTSKPNALCFYEPVSCLPGSFSHSLLPSVCLTDTLRFGFFTADAVVYRDAATF